ncbi:hypothetical protein RJ55_06659 [Drechmeria coniospora]|nr:hypothetical protein RJ55_06659 [Drechmeria coniospora]
MASHGVARRTQARTEDQRQKDMQKIKTYRELEDQIRNQASTGAFDEALFDLTSKLLTLNPEYYTIWNLRRRCLLASLSSPLPGVQNEASDSNKHDSELATLKSELAFTFPLLKNFPKCYWIWNFRRWILSQSILRLPVPVARKVWETELDLTSKMLSKDHRNFHAWGYRRIVVEKLESADLLGGSMAESEFAYTTAMIRLNLSNFSAWHSRSQLIPRLLDDRDADDKARSAFLAAELSLVREGLNVGPEDQSLWYYHQFLMTHIVDHHHRHSIAPALTISERIAYVRGEIDEIKDLLDDYDDIKWIYEALLEYTVDLSRLAKQEDAESHVVPIQDLQFWLSKLRALDPMRTGRWDDVSRAAGPAIG